MSDVDDSQSEAPDQVLASPGDDDDSADIAQQSPWKRDLTDLRAWCENRRFRWPNLQDALLPESHLAWAEALELSWGSNFSRGRVDFRAIPSAFNFIFSSKLSPSRTLALLQYFLGFVAELIMLDTVEDDEVADRISGMLDESITPACESTCEDLPFGHTYSPDESDPEWDILQSIGMAINRGLNPHR